MPALICNRQPLWPQVGALLGRCWGVVAMVVVVVLVRYVAVAANTTANKILLPQRRRAMKHSCVQSFLLLQ